MQQYPFALIVNNVEQRPYATHLPFLVEAQGNEIYLLSHMAAANPQWKHFDDNDALIVFSKPDAYISPTLYEAKESVPTWNYMAVHAYGKVTMAVNNDEAHRILHKTISCFEPSYLEQYNQLSDDYISKMVSGIKAFTIRVDDLQGKYKLSQNKSHNEQKKIIDHLLEKKDHGANEIARHMQKSMK